MGVTCPRCGNSAAAAAGPFCSYCGSYLAPLRWVAEPPPSARPPRPEPFHPPYAGPPRYTSIPRWGFPAAPWRAAAERSASTDPVRAARSLAGIAAPLLWATAAVTLLAAIAESWRYGLLLASREDALSALVVAASDAFVASAGTVSVVVAAFAGVALIAWTVRAAAAGAHHAGVRMPRSAREIVVGWLVPGLNLVVPGLLLAEIEHMVLARPAGARPRPSQLLRAWWGLWVAGGLLAVIVLAWSWRDGVQAMADGVVLHAVLDLLAAAVAATSAMVVVRLTWLLEPAAAKRELFVRSVVMSSPEVTATTAQ